MVGCKRPAEKSSEQSAPKKMSINSVASNVVQQKKSNSEDDVLWPDDLLAIADADLLGRLMPVLEATICVTQGSARVVEGDIAGLHLAKQAIKEMLILPRRCPELFRSTLTRPPRGLLLAGPPGTGKTLLAKWIATEAGATFFNISSSTVFSKWMGEAEKIVRVLFKLAQQRQPSVIFIDEVDAILGARGDNDSEGSRRVKNELLQSLDGLNSGTGVGTGDLLVVGATNLPWELDAAASRRFAKKLHIPLPGRDARRQRLSQAVVNHHNEMGLGEICLSDGEMDWLVRRTESFSMSDLNDLLREAALVPAREAYRALQESPDEGKLQPRLMTKADFTEALSQVFPNMDDRDAVKFREWNEKYGAVRGAEAMRDDVAEKKECGAQLEAVNQASTPPRSQAATSLSQQGKHITPNSSSKKRTRDGVGVSNYF